MPVKKSVLPSILYLLCYLKCFSFLKCLNVWHFCLLYFSIVLNCVSNISIETQTCAKCVCHLSTFYSDLHGSTSSHSGHIWAFLQEREHVEVPRTLQNLPECNGLQHQGKSRLLCCKCFFYSFFCCLFVPVIIFLNCFHCMSSISFSGLSYFFANDQLSS